MPYRQIIESCLAARIGAGGVSDAALAAALARTAPSLARLRDGGRPAERNLLALPGRTDDLGAIEATAQRFRATCDAVLVLGTGGSSLGARTLCALATGDGPDLHFLENVDPDGIATTLAPLDPHRTGALIVSKSGGTMETVAQALALLKWAIDGAGADAPAARMVAITEAADNPLRRLAVRHRIPLMDHDPQIGGRYSVLSLVGLLPAAIAGIDIAAVRGGARAVLDRLAAATGPAEVAPAAGAALAAALKAEHGTAISVLMPYVDRLRSLGFWYRQLWAESLGKAGAGTTPVAAAGTVDQHSQLQLYLDGPADKLVTIVTGPAAGIGPRLDTALAGDDPALAYLDGHAMGDLLDAAAGATMDSLARSGRPVRALRLDAVDARGLGALLMHFILETLIAADLWGVDPFGQPAVEDGKVLARARLAKMAKAPIAEGGA